MDVRLPNLGEGADSGSVVTLFVKEGDEIAKGQTILELENEKAVAPIPSPAAGRVTSIRVKAGDKISVGQVLITLSGGEEPATEAPPSKPMTAATKAAAPAAAEPSDAPAPEPAAMEEESEDAMERPSRKAGFPPPASPTIRRLAKDLGIDLTRVRGSEAGGRIVLQDVRQYIQRLQQLAFQKKKEQPRVPAAAEPVDFSKWGPVSVKPMSQLRQVISRRMVESWSAIPHVTQFDQADVTQIDELRKKHAGTFEAKGTRLTLTSFVVKAVAALLKKHPVLNASIDENAQSVVMKEYVHIGLAVDTDAGLLVPVIRDADTLSILEVSKAIQEVAEKARARKLSADDMKGGTFTISNQGGIGSRHFTPIINRPEVAILGLGRGALLPAVREGQIVPRLQLPLALSYDHRLIDGAQAARAMVDLVAALESFAEKDLKL